MLLNNAKNRVSPSPAPCSLEAIFEYSQQPVGRPVHEYEPTSFEKHATVRRFVALAVVLEVMFSCHESDSLQAVVVCRENKAFPVSQKLHMRIISVPHLETCKNFYIHSTGSEV